jgi:hypothetical protein
LKQACLDRLRSSIELLNAKATAEEVRGYRQFVLDLAERAANARREGFLGLSGERVSDAEREAIGQIASALA